MISFMMNNNYLKKSNKNYDNKKIEIGNQQIL